MPDREPTATEPLEAALYQSITAVLDLWAAEHPELTVSKVHVDLVRVRRTKRYGFVGVRVTTQAVEE